MERRNVTNISDYFDKGFIGAQLFAGDIVMVQGLHTFSESPPQPKGNDCSFVSRQTNRVRIEGIIDRRDATSVSAWSIWLRGQKNTCSIMRIGQIQRDDNILKIDATVLAIRAGDESFKSRDYTKRLAESGVAFRQYDFEERGSDSADET